MIKDIHIHNFTVFSDNRFTFSEGLNLLMGPNGVGKTHLMRFAYALIQGKSGVLEAIIEHFRPYKGRIQRLTRALPATITLTLQGGSQAKLAVGADDYQSQLLDCRIPSMLLPCSHPPKPAKTPPYGLASQMALSIIEQVIGKPVSYDNGQFFIQNIEFEALSEGHRRLATLWLLIHNGIMSRNSVLFWDNPETGLHPNTYHTLARILLGLSFSGVQIFASTHSYELVREIALLQNTYDSVMYHSLYLDDTTGTVGNTASTTYDELEPNSLRDNVVKRYEKEIENLVHKGHAGHSLAS